MTSNSHFNKQGIKVADDQPIINRNESPRLISSEGNTEINSKKHSECPIIQKWDPKYSTSLAGLSLKSFNVENSFSFVNVEANVNCAKSGQSIVPLTSGVQPQVNANHISTSNMDQQNKNGISGEHVSKLMEVDKEASKVHAKGSGKNLTELTSSTQHGQMTCDAEISRNEVDSNVHVKGKELVNNNMKNSQVQQPKSQPIKPHDLTKTDLQFPKTKPP